MSIEVSEQAVEDLKREMAHRLLYTVNWFILQHKQRVSVPFNTAGASVPGEYPHLRSGAGRDGTVTDTYSIEDCLANGLISRVGQDLSSWYMTWLAREKGRLGMLKTARDLEPETTAILEGGPA